MLESALELPDEMVDSLERRVGLPDSNAVQMPRLKSAYL